MQYNFLCEAGKDTNKKTQINYVLRDKAQELNRIIIQGLNPIDYLKATGSTDPRGEWETIRNWMRNFDESMYASIPLKYRLKLPEPSKRRG